MAKIGKFIFNNFQNTKVILYTGDQQDWMKYQDNDAMAYVLVVGTVIDYDEECGILTLESKDEELFYISEEAISIFWDAKSKFNLMANTTSTIGYGKRWLNSKGKDIM